jgi:hypothetical protein
LAWDFWLKNTHNLKDIYATVVEDYFGQFACRSMQKIYMPYDRRTKRKTKPLRPTMLRLPKMSANISRIVWKPERASILLKLYMASRKKTTPANNGMIE